MIYCKKCNSFLSIKFSTENYFCGKKINLNYLFFVLSFCEICFWLVPIPNSLFEIYFEVCEFELLCSAFATSET